MDTSDTETLAILDFYLEMGVDEVLAEAPQKHWRKPQTPASGQHQHQQHQDTSVYKTPSQPYSPIEAGTLPPVNNHQQGVNDATTMAAKASDLTELVALIERFEGCPLKQDAKNTVVYDGITDARILFLGEAPGAQEDAMGKPFVGVSGQLLDEMIAFIGLSRQKNIMISNTVFWRPLANRTPSDGDVAICLPFVRRIIALLQPAVIVFVGGVALKALTGINGITRNRGKWQTVENEGMSIPALPLFHPAYLLRQPAHKREAWRDLLSLREKLKELAVDFT